mmetsp:Transcript_11359/g.31758  ORF Transcript_11359/g.31758 Transcript_11359/m.31758 type:complete len:238 (+) Transcript_11359:30-743(+)
MAVAVAAEKAEPLLFFLCCLFLLGFPFPKEKRFLPEQTSVLVVLTSAWFAALRIAVPPSTAPRWQHPVDSSLSTPQMPWYAHELRPMCTPIFHQPPFFSSSPCLTAPTAMPTRPICPVLRSKDCPLSIMPYLLSGPLRSNTLFGSRAFPPPKALEGAVIHIIAALPMQRAVVLATTCFHSFWNLSFPLTFSSQSTLPVMVRNCSRPSLEMKVGSPISLPTKCLEGSVGKALVRLLVS